MKIDVWRGLHHRRLQIISAVNLKQAPNFIHIQARSSELCLEASCGLQLSINVSNQSRENGFSEHGLQVAGPLVDMVKARYYSAPYSYSRNTEGHDWLDYSEQGTQIAIAGYGATGLSS